MQQAILPKKFIERNAKLFGRENSEFLKSCEIKLQKTIRVNTLKNSVPEFLSAFEGKAELEKVPFCDYAFRVKKGPERLGFTLEHVVGKFIVQETSSLLPSLALNPGHGETVLDMCAAPGAKTTHLAQLMQNSGTIVALDLNKPRLEGLQFNLERLGVTNACVLFQDALQFRSRKLFDKILLDAPCSSEGEIRKDWKALSAWSETLIHSKSELQKKLIEKAFSLLRPEGEMVYSTCTLAPEENEEVVHHLLSKHPEAKLMELQFKNFKIRQGISEWNGKKFSSEIKKCIRVAPQDNDSEAFFLAKIKKTSGKEVVK